MKKVIYAILACGLLIGGCIDKGRTNPFDPEYDGPTGTIRGLALLEGASAVVFTGPTGNTVRLNHAGITLTILEISRFTAVTDVFGNYSFQKVPPGTWTITASKQGFNSQYVGSVTVSSGTTTWASDITLTESVRGQILFGSQNTGTGFNELILMNPDGSGRGQLSFQDVNMVGGDPLEGTQYIALDIDYIGGNFSAQNTGFFLYDRILGEFSPLVLGEEVFVPNVVEGTTSDLNWGPSPDPPITRKFQIFSGAANADLGFSPTSITETSNKGLIYEFDDAVNSDHYIALLDIVAPAGGAPHLPATLASSQAEPYVIQNGADLNFAVDTGAPDTITFDIGASPGDPDLALTGASIFKPDPLTPSTWYAKATSVQVAVYINLWAAIKTPPLNRGISAAGNGRGVLLIRPKPAVTSTGPFRVTGAPGDNFQEFDPDVSPDNILAYVSREEDINGSNIYRIQTVDLSIFGNPPMTNFLNNINALGAELQDFDNDLSDGVPDATKLRAIWLYYINVCGQWVDNFAGVDWSEIVLDPATLLLPAGSPCDASQLVGTIPDNVSMVPDIYDNELGDITEMWDPAWSPVPTEVWKTDGTMAIHPWLVFGTMRNSTPKAIVKNYDIQTTTNLADFPNGACNDIGGAAGCNLADGDEPLDPFFDASVTPIWVDIEDRIEFFSLKGLVLDQNNNYQQVPLLDDPLDGTFFVVDPEENSFVAQPAVSPDGDRVVYVSGVRSKASGDLLNGDVYSWDYIAGFIKKLTFDAMQNRGPMWLE